jgi:hypothetical protein
VIFWILFVILKPHVFREFNYVIKCFKKRRACVMINIGTYCSKLSYNSVQMVHGTCGRTGWFKKCEALLTNTNSYYVRNIHHTKLHHTITSKVKVKQSHYRPGQALRVPGG